MFIETPCTLYMHHRPEIITLESTYVIQSKSPFKELQARFLTVPFKELLARFLTVPFKELQARFLTVPFKESDRLFLTVVQLLYIAGYSH